MKKLVFLSLMLFSCGPDVKEDDLDLSSSNSVLILNGKGENFSLVSQSEDRTKVTRNLSISLRPDQDAHPCKAPNHVTRFGGYLYLTCSLNHEIQIVDMKTMKVVRNIAVGNSANPMQTLIVDENTAYTTAFNSNNILHFTPKVEVSIEEGRFKTPINLNSLNLKQSGAAFPRPSGIVSINGIGYVALSNLDAAYSSAGPGYVVAFDLKTKEVVKLIESRGINTTEVFASPTLKNLLYIVNTGGYTADKRGSIDVYDVVTSQFVNSLEIPGSPGRLAFSPDGFIVYVADLSNPKIYVFEEKRDPVVSVMNLKDKLCKSNTTFTMMSSILVDGDLLYTTEFNSDCLIIMNRKSGALVNRVQTGSGPVYMMKL